jgi:hypothetical protein
MPFPPKSVYPVALDSDYTLFKVYNTTETKLAADNAPWSQEIEILSVGADELEIWADNGFGNVDGELFYYDSVAKNTHGKVYKLKGCARQVGGEKTKFNRKGTWVRSYVVAEHHNQLVEAILKTQNFIGRQFDERIATLDWRIRNLRELEVVFDDFACPDVNFTFNVVDNNPVTGILAQYLIEITPPGSISSFRLDFGDGEFTTTALQGQHRYALNARVDPVVRASNDKCQIIQTPIERENPAEPAPTVNEVFDLPIPEFPNVPDFTFVPCTVPEPEFILPPLVEPCISIEGQLGPIPSIIIGPNINLVSQVVITSTNPINITQSVVQIVGGENIPSIILIEPPIPPTIIIEPPIPPTIILVPPQSNITFDLDLTNVPRLEVDWGMPPNMEVALTFAKAVKSPSRFTADPKLVSQFGSEFADLFEANDAVKVEYEPVGIPSEIKVVVPEEMKLGIDGSDLAKHKIKIDCSEVNLPKDIFVHGPDAPIPTSISFEPHDLPSEIPLVYKGQAIPVDASSVPTTIKIEDTIPERIVVEMPRPIPERIIVESNIPSEITLLAPESIPIHVPKDVFLPVKFPDVMPQLEMVYKGAPIELKITMDELVSKTADGKQCVMLIPCK